MIILEDKEKNEILESALRNLKVQALNVMQQTALSHSSTDQNMVLLSPTGTGKTIAFLLPLITNMSNESTSIQALILTPSRELALQIAGVFTVMNTPWKCCCCYGGHSMSEERRVLSTQNPAVVIGTPGRITDHISKGTILTDGIEHLVIDEFDKSLEYGFQEEMEMIIGQLHHLKKRILASATDTEEIPNFVEMSHTVRLDFLNENTDVVSRIRLMKVLSPEKDKINTLYRLLCHLDNSSSIVFCNHREAVDRVSNLLREMGFSNERYHGGMEQADRERSLYKFRNGSAFVLISTDLASRGLDIPDVAHIIHYHLPVNEETFTHRNGRTARWDTTGESFLILNEAEVQPDYLDKELPVYELDEQTPAPPKAIWATIYIGKGKKDKISKGDVAGFLYKKGQMQSKDIGPIDVKEHCTYVSVRQNRVKHLIQLVQGEKIKGIKTIIEESK